MYKRQPVIGFIETGAAAGVGASRAGEIAIIATEGTVRGGSYQRAIARLRPDATVVAQACPLFVALAEEGWTEGPIVEAIAHRYLDEVFAQHPRIDTLLLGCTHFPLFTKVLHSVVRDSVAIVDSAQTTAEALAQDLVGRRLTTTATVSGRVTLLATDSPERFARVGSRFLGEAFESAAVELVDLTG